MYGSENKPLRGEKFTFYEGGTRTAAFVTGPSIRNRAGETSNEYT